LKALEDDGYEVFSAFDGKKGFELIKKEMPDLAMIDIMMPEVNGIELMEMLKKDENLSKIPIIVLSNIDDEETLKKVGDLQTQFYLIKSLYDPKKVVGIVKEVLHHKK